MHSDAKCEVLFNLFGNLQFNFFSQLCSWELDVLLNDSEPNFFVKRVDSKWNGREI